MNFPPKITIIIATKNAKKMLVETLQSIKEQQYRPLEVIVVDGASTDGTLEIITAFQDVVTFCLSEPDSGISDAFNKGLKYATGDYINFQGAGDTLYAPLALQKLFVDLDESVELVCGKVMRVKEDGITPIWVAPKKIKPFKRCSLLFKMSLPHQGLFTHRRFFERFGKFDTTIKFAMDYELLLRAYDQFPKCCVRDVMVSRWRAGGIGENRILEVLDEYHRIKLKHQVAAKKVLAAINKFNRFKYFFKTKWLKLIY